MRAIYLRTEYLVDPIGIDIQKPRLSWNCEGGERQTAYRITAESSGKTVWDSGIVKSGKMTGVEYPNELVSRQRVEWSVRLWDENDEAGELSDPAFFEMGLLNSSDWQAEWISGNYKVDKKRRYPVDCFCKRFETKPVVRARLYASACGIYELCLNGVKVGDFKLAPGHTDYRKRIQYQCCDVAELINNGENTLSAELADGWYRGSCGAWGLRNQYGTKTKLLVQLELFYEDGEKQIIVTDGSWNWSNDGAIRFADNKDGEIVDANMTPSLGGKAKLSSHNVVPTASNNVILREQERFAVKELIKTPSGKTVLDFGQNIAGCLSFSLEAKKGQHIKLRFGEMLDGDGEFSQKNIQCVNKNKCTPMQELEYTAKEGRNEYNTKFAIFGFRYVLVETDIPIDPGCFCAIAVYSDMEETLSFDSSNVLLNDFVKATIWAAKGNSADVPTDCPTRERHGWSGDAQIFASTASYLFNYEPFARKYQNDLCDAQFKNGAFPQIAPYGGVDFFMTTMNGSVGWADAGVLIPYHLWKRYADERIIADNYKAMKRYAEFMIKRCGKLDLLASPLHISAKNRRYLVNSGQSYGEWLEPVDIYPFGIKNFIRPHPEESTAYTAYIMRHMAEIAGHLGYEKDKALYEEYAEGCTLAYQELVSTEKHSLSSRRQAKLVRPLMMGLLNDEQSEFAKKQLIKLLEDYKWRVGTGFLSTPFILYVLQDMDIEYAYKLLENEECPGWLFMPKFGATTVWENWEGNSPKAKGIGSLNHYSKGAVCEWLFCEMCGIKVSGENRFTVAPKPGGSFTFASTAYRSIFGEVKSGWRRENGKTQYEISIPANCSAEIILPSGEKHEVGAGDYKFTDR